MPELCRFYNIVIKMIFSDTDEHHKPHFHVYYNEYEASVGVDGELIAGSLPVKQLKLVQAWAAIHEDELYAAWNKKFFKPNYDEIVETIRLIAPYFDDFVLEPQEGNEEQIVLRWRQTGCEDVFNASQLSDGTLRFICLTTLLLQPHELQPATIIVDEPELGLHPYAITIFSEIVRQLFNEKQIMISTQSVELLNKFDVEDVIVVDRSDTGSEFRRLDPEQLKLWLDGDCTLGDLWKKNVLGGRLTK